MPMMMMRASARSLPAVKMSCTLVAHLTLEQFTHVSSTKHTKVEYLGKELVLSVQPQTHVDICTCMICLEGNSHTDAICGC